MRHIGFAMSEPAVRSGEQGAVKSKQAVAWCWIAYERAAILEIDPSSGKRPIGLPEDIPTGFVAADGNARGRPVGVAVDSQGALLVADDVGNKIWRVTAK
jgi:glucose/arabinose dehydrogenase